MPLSLSSCTVGAALVVVELNCTISDISDISGLSSTDSEAISTDVAGNDNGVVPVVDGSFLALVVSIVVVVDVGEDAISVDGISVDGIGVDDMGDGDDANVVDGVLGGVLFKRWSLLPLLFPFLRFLGVGSKVDGIGKDKSESVFKIQNQKSDERIEQM